mgnify:FL=1
MKQQLLDKAKALLEPLEYKAYQFADNTITPLVLWDEETTTELLDILVSCSTDQILLISRSKFTPEEGYDIDNLGHFSTEEVSTIVNILETQLNQA